MTYGFIIDNRRCIGCHACTVACKAEHNTPVGVNRTWVKYVEKGIHPYTRRVFTVHRCNHCGDAPCVEICPVTSLFVRDDGIVDFDRERCIGCKACMQACPYDALHIDPETQTSTKCNYCAHRIDRGLEPACVIVCPVQAIISGDLDDPESPIAQLAARTAMTVRKPEKGTQPHLFYIDGDESTLSPTDAPPQLEYAAAEQSTGVGHFAAYAAIAAPPAQITTQEKIMGQGAGSGPSASITPAQPEIRVYDAPSKGVLWDWEVVGYLWTKSLAAGLVMVPVLLSLLGAADFRPRMDQALAWCALLALGATGILLVMDLDRPARFIYVLLRPQWRSWLVRGAYAVSAFGLCTFLWVLHLHFGSGPVTGLRWLLVVLGLLTAVYTAFLFAQAKGRDAWQSPLLPLHMLLRSVVTGSAATILLGYALQANNLIPVANVLTGALVLNGLLLLAEFTIVHVTADTRLAYHLMTRGSLRLPFWSGVLLGIVLPLLLIVLLRPGLPQGFWMIPMAGLALVFSLAMEHVWVRAPQLVPLR